MEDQIKKTPLHEEHLKLGARMVNFGGWLMPVQYTGIIEEHNATRTTAGLFDVSHMGEIEITGSGALSFVQMLTTNDASRLAVGQCQYSLFCYPWGGVVDDLLVYRLGQEEFLLVVNAGNKDKDYAWIKSRQGADSGSSLVIRDKSADTGQIAIQGPRAQQILSRLTGYNLEQIHYYYFDRFSVGGMEALVSRTGYTGEDGFEIYVDTGSTAELWRLLLEMGRDLGLVPAGLGARDTLRFEARMPLYGHELNDKTTPLEAGLGMFVSWNKGDFLGREALLKQKEEGLKRKLVGFTMIDRGVPRSGYSLGKNGIIIGEVASGSFAPTLKSNLGLGYVNIDEAHVGNEITVQIRDKELKAQIVKTPFYKREGK